jgi:hypothetical protein
MREPASVRTSKFAIADLKLLIDGGMLRHGTRVLEDDAGLFLGVGRDVRLRPGVVSRCHVANVPTSRDLPFFLGSMISFSR